VPDTVDRQLGRAVAKHLRAGLVLSDEQCKQIREHTDMKEVARALIEMGPPYSPEEIDIIHKNCDEPFHAKFEDSDDWTDDTLRKYAEHVQNFYYNYKPEAQNIDPSIDTNEKHLGPMAQDIEKVNPAAVKETEDGTKVVDTGRLALMNAGAIGDIARRLMELEGKHIQSDSNGPTGGRDIPSDAGIKTDVSALYKPQFRKSLLNRVRRG
jgi:hypothetical protein